jgi:hypothetical protein
MELTAQMAALEDELKVLKGEIKSILTEIRTSVLTRDNPFAPETGVPVFRPVERPLPDDQTSGEGTPEAEVDSSTAALRQAPASEPAEPLPHVVRVEPAAADQGGEASPTAAPEPRLVPAEPAAGQARTSGRPRGTPEPKPDQEAALPAWSVPTIAGLVAWADETASRIGPTHMQMVLELARFAGLISTEAEEPLLKIVKLAASRKDSAAASVNDSLVALRQLEAIFRGEQGDELALLRRHWSA